MIYLVSDTKIVLHTRADAGSQGGSSAYLSGIINQLLGNQIEFGLIGNFEINDKLRRNAHLSHPSTNLSFLKYLIKLFLVKKFDQDDIFYFQRPDHLACSIGSKKIRILHLHGQQRTNIIRSRNLLTKFNYLFLERIAMRHADLILATDKRTASVYVTQYPFIAKKIRVVPTGIDLSFFSSPTDPPSPPEPKPIKELIYIGRLAPPKLLHEMLRAFQLVIKNQQPFNTHPPPRLQERGSGGEVLFGTERVSGGEVNSGTERGSHFTLAGAGPLLPALQRSVIEMGLEQNVTFTGILSKDQIRDLIFNSDAAILLSAHEGSPISVKEVLACGKPVIVNDVGDLSDYVIPGRNGYIVNPENSREVAAAIINAFENSTNMRKACINSMLPYDESLINPEIVKLILDCKPV